MRITNNMITSRYTRSLNSLSGELNRLNTQVSSGRKFSNSSEDTAAAVQAYQIRSDFSMNEGYISNIEHAQSSLTNAETSLTQMEELMQTAAEKILQGMNGTQNSSDRSIIATELRSIQGELFQALNSKASDAYIFGGTNTDSAPFTLTDAGTLCYNGQALTVAPLTEEENIIFNNKVAGLGQDSLNVDIGLGMQFDSSGAPKAGTVFGYSIPGIKISGSGTVRLEGVIEDVPNNLYDLLGVIADEFESENYSSDKLDALYGHFASCSGSISQSITQIGAKSSYLNFMSERYDAQSFNLQERQLSVEGVDAAYTIIEYKSQQVAYQAALQMGTTLIQASIFDFMS